VGRTDGDYYGSITYFKSSNAVNNSYITCVVNQRNGTLFEPNTLA